MVDVIIIGAGLSGLATAYNLKKQGISCKILEAQNRLGGRIETIYGTDETPMEMGATWFSREHTQLLSLLKELDIEHFEQHTEGMALFETMSFEPPQQYFVPANTHSAYRVSGGTYQIIEKLLKEIGSENVQLNTEISEIIEEGEQIRIVDSSQNNHFCKRVVVAMPPRMLEDRVKFTPNLNAQLQQLMQKTQTWMTGSTKFAVEYKRPFWKDLGFSGSVYSQSGLATEMYDHTNVNETKFALLGFLNGSAVQFSFEERRRKVIEQLKSYFGEEAMNFLSYNDKIWNDKFIQSRVESFLPAHANNGQSLYQSSYMNERLFFTGTETSKLHSGYMEGAVIAAEATAMAVSKV